MSDVVTAARKYLGVTEKPYGSNCQPFSRRLGRPCEKWCGDFTTCCYLDVGVDLRTALTPLTASVHATYLAARKRGWLVPRDQAEPDDLLIFQFDRDPAADHIEVCTEAPARGRIRSIGGNTGTRGLQSNGGGVYEQYRPITTVMAVIRVPRSIPAPTPPPTDRPQEDDDMADYVTIKEPATAPGDVPAGAVVMYTPSTWCHLTPDAWSLEERMARLRGQALVPPVISRTDMRAIQASRIDVTALNAAAHR